MSCPACGTENRGGRALLPFVWLSARPACPNGHAVSPEARFCDECGAALEQAGATAPVAAPPREAPAAERRLVTVLFADLVGFTAASEERDAEETRELLSRYFDTCRRLIELYGGTVEKFIGDAVMAVWGTPTATEDDAERAVRAALDLVARRRARRRSSIPPSTRGPGSSPARPPSRWAPRARAWSQATSSTRPRVSSQPRSPAPSSSGRRRDAHRSRRSRTRRPAFTS